MADVKWIKITTNMFEDEKIDFIESLPEADAILVVWIKLLTMAGKNNSNGFIFLTEQIPYTVEMLAHRFRRPLNTVKLALETLKNLEMINFDEDGFLNITNWEKHQNVEGLERIREQTRKRVARYRERQKQLEGGNVTGNEEVTGGNETELEEDIDIDIDIDIEEDTAIGKTATAPHKEIVELYNSICISFNSVKQITERRKGNMNARYRENDCNVEVFRTVFEKVQNSNFLKRGWDTGGKADFEWIMRPTNFVKILEGKYDDKPIGGGSGGTNKQGDTGLGEYEGLGIDLSNV